MNCVACRMPRVLLGLLALVASLTVGCFCEGGSSAVGGSRATPSRPADYSTPIDKVSRLGLPAHSMKYEFLPPDRGRRITIEVPAADLSRDDCLALIAAYEDFTGPRGLVTVHKPNRALGGGLDPYCVHPSGEAPRFNDKLFGE